MGRGGAGAVLLDTLGKRFCLCEDRIRTVFHFRFGQRLATAFCGGEILYRRDNDSAVRERISETPAFTYESRTAENRGHKPFSDSLAVFLLLHRSCPYNGSESGDNRGGKRFYRYSGFFPALQAGKAYGG